MTSELYLKFYLTEKQATLNTCIYLDLTDLEFKYLVAAWIYLSSKKKDVFNPADLNPILKLMKGDTRYRRQTFANKKMNILEKKGYLEFVYCKYEGYANGKRYYQLNFEKIHQLMNVLVIFYHEYLKKYIKVVGTFGNYKIKIPKNRDYYKIKRDVVKHINNLRG